MKPSAYRLSLPRVSVLLASFAAFSVVPYATAQAPVQVTPGTQQTTPQAPTPRTQPDQSVPNQMPPDTRAPKGGDTSTAKTTGNSSAAATPSVPDRAAAYYHYSLAHMYEEMVAMYQRTEFANKAIDEYKLALQNDPNSSYLNAGLASLYFHTNRVHDAIDEAQQVINRDPNNVDARRLLGGIYLQLLGDTQSAPQSREMLQKAIEQYEAIVRIDASDVDSHLLLGRLYMLDK